MRYDGNFAIQVESGTFETVTSLLECKELCMNNDECRYFNYNKSNKKCFPRSGMGKRVNGANNFVYGHKHVEGGNISCIIVDLILFFTIFSS